MRTRWPTGAACGSASTRRRCRRSTARSRSPGAASEPAATRATASSRPHVDAAGVAEELVALGYDAQTAGGLLVSLPADKALSLAAEFRARDLFLRRIGSVEAGAGVVVS